MRPLSGVMSRIKIVAATDNAQRRRLGSIRDGRATLTSAGGGVRLNPIDGLIGSLEVAKPLNRNVAEEGNQDARVFFSLTAQF